MQILRCVGVLLMLSSMGYAQVKSSSVSTQEDSLQHELLIQQSYKKARKISTLYTLIPPAAGLLIAYMPGSGGGYFALLTGCGIIFGPSMGHFYLGNVRRGITGGLIRSTAAFLIIGGGIVALYSGYCDDSYDCDENYEAGITGLVAAISGAILLPWSFFKGFSSQRTSAREKYERQHEMGLFLRPGYRGTFQIGLQYRF